MRILHRLEELSSQNQHVCPVPGLLPLYLSLTLSIVLSAAESPYPQACGFGLPLMGHPYVDVDLSHCRVPFLSSAVLLSPQEGQSPAGFPAKGFRTPLAVASFTGHLCPLTLDLCALPGLCFRLASLWVCRGKVQGRDGGGSGCGIVDTRI